MEDGGVHDRGDRGPARPGAAVGGADAPADPGHLDGRAGVLTPPPAPGIDALPLPLARRLHRLCTEFEDAWRRAGSGGGRPRPADFLARVPGADRLPLLGELLPLDAYYRRAAGEHPRPEEYADLPGVPDLGWVAAALAFADPGDTPPDDTPHPADRPGPAAGGPGRLGRFELVGRVGAGGFGEVWQARDTELGRAVALKLPHPALLAAAGDRERFAREARAAARLRHPGVVAVHEVLTLDGRPAIVSDFVAGPSLKDLLAAGRPAVRDAVALAVGVADALDYAHAMGVVHRDVKPANILVEPAAGGGFGRPVLTDFGLARWDDAGASLTAEGAVVGTPAYMAPEQAAGGGHRADGRSDVYALGAVLYELLTGERPFRGPAAAVLDQVLHAEPRPPRRADPAVPRDLETVCLKAMAKDPGGRYQSAREFADDLRRWLAGEPVAARPAGWVERGAKWARRRPAAAAAAVLAVVAVGLTGLAGGTAWLWRRAEAAREDAVRAHGVAEADRAAAEAARERLAAVEYGRTIQVAYQEWEHNNVAGALALLEGTRPEFRGWEWHYVHRLCHSDLYTVSKVDCAIQHAALSPDGRRVVVACYDGTARLWDAGGGGEGAVLRMHPRPVGAAAFSPDGRRVVTAGFDGAVRVWDAETGAELRTLRGHREMVYAAAFSPDATKVVTGGADGTARVWDAETGAEVVTFRRHKEAVRAAGFSPDGRRVVTAGQDQTVRIWDAGTGAEVVNFRGHRDRVGLLAAGFSPDGRRVVTAGGGGARVWDAATGAELLALRGHAGTVRAAAFSPDGSLLATAGADQTLRVWDAAAGAEVATLRGHTASVNAAAFFPDGRRVLTAGADGTARVWDTTARPEFKAYRAQSINTDAWFSRDGTGRLLLLLGDRDGSVRLWDVSGRVRTNRYLPRRSGQLYAARFSPDGRRVVTAGRDQAAVVSDSTTGADLRTLRGHTGSLFAASFSPDGGRVVTAGADRTARVWDAETGAELAVLRGHAAEVNDAAFSPDGRRVVTASRDHTARVWDAATGSELLAFRGHADQVYSAVVSLDGSRVVTASNDGTARVWDAGTGAEVRTLRGHNFSVRAATFSPDGGRVVTVGWDSAARVWDTRTGSELLVLRGLGGPPSVVAFSPDGLRLVTGVRDETRVWDATPVNRAFRPREAAPPPRPAG